MGFFLALASTYTSEISPLPLRPVLTAAINFFMNSGQLAAMAIGSTRIGILTPDSYKITFAAQWAFPCAILLFALILPESLWYLIRKGKYTAAEANIQRLYARPPSVTKGYLEFLKATIEQESQLRSAHNAPGYSSCFKGTDFRRTRIACGMFLVQQFAG